MHAKFIIMGLVTLNARGLVETTLPYVHTEPINRSDFSVLMGFTHYVPTTGLLLGFNLGRYIQ